MSCCIRSFMYTSSTTSKRIDRLYRQFSFSSSNSNARIWLSFRLSFVAGLSFISVEKIFGNVDTDMFILLKRKLRSSPISGFSQGMPP